MGCKNFPVPSYQRSDLRRGFTLIELMLSIALVLLLVIGINYVFKATADAVGAGEEIGTITRDTQSAQPMIFDDFRNIAKNPPCFIIASQIVTEFLNADDAATGSDPTRYTDASGITYVYGNGNSTATTIYISPALYNYRPHRCDMVRFPAHGFYPRRSANTGSFTSPTTAEDAFITIAHGALPTQVITYNPNNLGQGPQQLFAGPCNDATPFTIYNAAGAASTTTTLATQRVGAYASDWALARSVLLMKDPNTITTATPNDVYYPVVPNGSQPPTYYANGVGPNITPLGYDSLDNNSIAANQTKVESSRYDLAGITVEQFRRQIADCLIQWRAATYPGTQGTPSYLWWNPLIYDEFFTQMTATPLVLETGNPPTAAALPIIPNSYYALVGAAGAPNPQYAYGTSGTANPNLTRSQCNPLIQTPLSSQAVAQMAPYFLQHCSQFIVEYAGDYIQQDNNPLSTDPKAGEMTGIGPDGQIDYVLDANGNKRIRWYGMPRSFYNGPNPSTSTIIRGFDPTNDPTILADTVNGLPSVKLGQFVDVIPLRDYWWLYAAIANNAAVPIQSPPWEVDVNFDPTKDYANPTASTYLNNVFQTTNTANPQKNARYACAWHDDMPALIRILIKVDDPNNKVKDGPWYEYIFKLK